MKRIQIGYKDEICYNIISAKEKQAAAKQTFVFLALLANEYPAKQDIECEARIRELEMYGCRTIVRIVNGCCNFGSAKHGEIVL